MIKKIVIYVLFLSGLGLIGCSIPLGSGSPAKTYYVLEDITPVEESAAGTYDVTLLVRDAVSSRFIDSRKIIFAEEASQRGYYQFALWVDPPPVRFTQLLVRRLEESKIVKRVATAASSVRAEYQLNTDLLDFYHDTSKNPGKAVVTVRGELVDLRERRVIASRVFRNEVDVSRYSVEGAVKGFNRAVSEILDDLSEWLSSVIQ